MSTQHAPHPSEPRIGWSEGLLVAQRTYRYVRAAIVGLLIALAVAVVYQSVQQGSLLASISAYYYTPAQAIFVGSLIGLGVAMISLKGTTDVEDVLLNLGGMLAAVIAVVPTSRGEDFRAAVRACRTANVPVLTDQAPGALDCPTVQSLEAATRANVENNMSALLVVGAIALAATVLFAWVERAKGTGSAAPTASEGSPGRPATWGRKLAWGLGIAATLYLAVLVAFWVSVGWFIGHAHYIAAAGLFLCIVAVVVANAVRKNREVDAGVTVTELARDRGRWYLALATVMVVAAVVLAVLVWAGVLTLFWLEAVLVVLFAVFWVAQTWEQWDPPPVVLSD